VQEINRVTQDNVVSVEELVTILQQFTFGQAQASVPEPRRLLAGGSVR